MPAQGSVEISESRALEYWESFPARWDAMAEAWRRPDGPQARGLWLIGHANYVLRTNCLWAVDPALRAAEARAWALPRAAQALEGLGFVLLTHLHDDHYSPDFLNALGQTGARFLVPDFMPPEDVARLGRTGARVYPVRPGERYAFEGARIDVLPGWHYDDGQGRVGVPALGYRVLSEGQVFMFPGDIRDYGGCRLPSGADLLLAHLWLGRGAALRPPWEPKLTEFCDWVARLAPRRTLLTHLYDFSRGEAERWGTQHAACARERLARMGLGTFAPTLGQRIPF